jgi:hypothetical protein
VADRLQVRFGADASMTHGPAPDGGYAVTLLMPLVTRGC